MVHLRVLYGRYGNPRSIVLALFALGILIRVAWLASRGLLSPIDGEAEFVAITFGRTGHFADAYKLGGGIPTAHFLPIPPLVAGLVYRALGVRTNAAELVLACLSLTMVLSAYYLFYRAFLKAGMKQLWALLALAFLLIVPLNVSLEVVGFRFWEGGYMLFLSAAMLNLILNIDAEARTGAFRIWLLLVGAALLFFISPQAGLGAYACVALLQLKRRLGWNAVKTLLAGALALALVFTPWVIRNEMVFGKFIPLRSNLGLELSLGFYEGAQLPQNEKTFRGRLKQIHPFESDDAYARLKRSGGEVEYAAGLQKEATAWIAAHPGAALWVAIRHILDLLFPTTWFWHIYGEAGRGVFLKAALNWAISAGGLFGMFLAALRFRERMAYAALFLAVMIMPYVMVQPILRYRAHLVPLLIFLGAWAAQILWDRFVAPALSRRRGAPERA